MSVGRRAVGLLAVVIMLAAVGPSAAVPGGGTGKGLCPTGKPPSSTISKIQAIQFELMRRSSFNSFDGVRVAGDLVRHRQLWCGAFIDRLGDDALIKLRDIGENSWNVDTLYVLSSNANNPALGALARHWRADAVQWVAGPAAGRLMGTSGSYRILEVWWD